MCPLFLINIPFKKVENITKIILKEKNRDYQKYLSINPKPNIYKQEKWVTTFNNLEGFGRRKKNKSDGMVSHAYFSFFFFFFWVK